MELKDYILYANNCINEVNSISSKFRQSYNEHLSLISSRTYFGLFAKYA